MAKGSFDKFYTATINTLLRLENFISVYSFKAFTGLSLMTRLPSWLPFGLGLVFGIVFRFFRFFEQVR